MSVFIVCVFSEVGLHWSFGLSQSRSYLYLEKWQEMVHHSLPLYHMNLGNKV